MSKRKEYLVKGPPAMPPVHPGALLRDDVLPALGLGVRQAAAVLGVSRQTLYSLLRGASAVSPEMALRLGAFFGNGPELWLRMQAAHDIRRAERALGRAALNAIANRAKRAA